MADVMEISENKVGITTPIINVERMYDFERIAMRTSNCATPNKDYLKKLVCVLLTNGDCCIKVYYIARTVNRTLRTSVGKNDLLHKWRIRYTLSTDQKHLRKSAFITQLCKALLKKHVNCVWG